MEAFDPTVVQWRTSSRSAGGECVEVALDATTVLVRDSKHPDRAVLAFSADEWREFVCFVRTRWCE